MTTIHSIPLPVYQATSPIPGNGTPLPLHDEDPYELVGMVIPGEEGQTETMAQALIEEFIMLGWSEKRLMTLFNNPLYLGTYRIYQEKGEAWVQQLITDICRQWRITSLP